MADRPIARAPELTDFQQQFLSAKEELLARRAAAATGDPPPRLTNRSDSSFEDEALGAKGT